MLSEQVDYLMENYSKHMKKEHIEISETLQKQLRAYTINLADCVDIYAKSSGGSTRSDKLDFNLKNKTEGPLRGPDKFEFLSLICRNVHELLSSTLMPDTMRCYKAGSLCLISRIDPNIFSQWMPVPKRKKFSFKIYKKK